MSTVRSCPVYGVIWAKQAHQCDSMSHCFVIHHEKYVVVPHISQSDAFFVFGFVLPFAFLFHSVTMSFCIAFGLCPLQTVGSELSLPWIPWFGIFYLSVILRVPPPLLYFLIPVPLHCMQVGNKHVGAWTCPRNTAVALRYLWLSFLTQNRLYRGLCSQRT